jgi:Fe-S-cluster formation regulator IscX/YfhJ|tara:strand:+ start:947 stop:1090 length:144 start_codon:yes stop_codon:yes gene_type:complete
LATPDYDELADEFTNIHLLVLLLESFDQRLAKSGEEGLSERVDEGGK